MTPIMALEVIDAFMGDNVCRLCDRKHVLPLCRSVWNDGATIREAKRSPVASLTWQEAADGLVAGPYRVRRVSLPGQRRWQLEIIRSGLGWQEEPAVSEHRTRRAALAAAAMYERHRIRRVRLQIHLTLFAVASAAWIICSSSTEWGLFGFVVWVALFAVAINSLASALDVFDSSVDDEVSRDADRLLAIERWVRVDSLIPPHGYRTGDAAADEVKVRVLDPLG